MSRLVLFLFAIGMLSGCSGPAAQEPKTKEPGKNELPASAKPAQVAEDFIAGSWKGSEFDILAVKEQPTSLRKTSAVAVYVQWKIRGEEEARHELLLVQRAGCGRALRSM